MQPNSYQSSSTADDMARQSYVVSTPSVVQPISDPAAFAPPPQAAPTQAPTFGQTPAPAPEAPMTGTDKQLMDVFYAATDPGIPVLHHPENFDTPEKMAAFVEAGEDLVEMTEQSGSLGAPAGPTAMPQAQPAPQPAVDPMGSLQISHDEVSPPPAPQSQLGEMIVTPPEPAPMAAPLNPVEQQNPFPTAMPQPQVMSGVVSTPQIMQTMPQAGEVGVPTVMQGTEPAADGTEEGFDKFELPAELQKKAISNFKSFPKLRPGFHK